MNLAVFQEIRLPPTSGKWIRWLARSGAKRTFFPVNNCFWQSVFVVYFQGYNSAHTHGICMVEQESTQERVVSNSCLVILKDMASATAKRKHVRRNIQITLHPVVAGMLKKIGRRQRLNRSSTLEFLIAAEAQRSK